MTAPEETGELHRHVIEMQLQPREVVIIHALMALALCVLSRDAVGSAEVIKAIACFGEEGADMTESAFRKIDAMYKTLSDVVEETQGGLIS